MIEWTVESFEQGTVKDFRSPRPLNSIVTWHVAMPDVFSGAAVFSETGDSTVDDVESHPPIRITAVIKLANQRVGFMVNPIDIAKQQEVLIFNQRPNSFNLDPLGLSDLVQYSSFVRF